MKLGQEEGVLHLGERFRIRLYDENVDGLFDAIDGDEDRFQILKDKARAEKETKKYVVLDATNGNILKKFDGYNNMCGVGSTLWRGGNLSAAIIQAAEEEGGLLH